MINLNEINVGQVNQFGPANSIFGCEGITLADLRQRLRNELSTYAAGTLIPNEQPNDIELQFINDGIDELWPHDYQVVNKSFVITNQDNRFILPDDAEHTFAVYSADVDVNNNKIRPCKLPHHDAWMFDKSYIDAVSGVTMDAQPWVDRAYRAVILNCAPRSKWLIVRYARKWPHLELNTDCIDPTPNRVHSIIYFACAQYFISQFQVNTESIRYRNYQAIANSFMQLFQSNLIKDSKPLWIS